MLGNYVYRRPFDYAAQKRRVTRFAFPVFQFASFTSAGTGAFSAVGQSVASSTFTSAGTCSTAFVTVSGGLATFNADGVSTVSFIGTPIASGVLTAPGTCTVAFAGQVSSAATAIALSVLAAQAQNARRARIKTNKFPYEEIDRRMVQFPLNNAPSVFSMPGTSSVTLNAKTLFTSTLTAAGTSTADFQANTGFSGVLNAAGTSSVSWVSSLGAISDFAMAGTSTATFNATATTISVWTSAGVGTLNFFLKGNASPRRKGGRKRFFRFIRSI